MGTMITILSVLMIFMAIFLVVAVLMQSGKDSRLSGTIAGGAETFFGKTKGKTIDRVLSKATTVVAIIFVILVFVVYVMQRNISNENITVSGNNDSVVQTQEDEHDHENETEEESVTEEVATAEEAATAENAEDEVENEDENEAAEDQSANNE